MAVRLDCSFLVRVSLPVIYIYHHTLIRNGGGGYVSSMALLGGTPHVEKAA